MSDCPRNAQAWRRQYGCYLPCGCAGDPDRCVAPRDENGEFLSSREDKAQRRKDLRCSFCVPNRAENAKRKAKHGTKKAKARGCR